MVHDAPLTCRDTTYLVSDARDRQLTEREMEDLRQHIRVCPHCQVASRQFHVLYAGIDELLARHQD